MKVTGLKLSERRWSGSSVKAVRFSVLFGSVSPGNGENRSSRNCTSCHFGANKHFELA